MALPTICVQESIADKFVAKLTEVAKELKIGPAYDKTTDLGPVVTADHEICGRMDTKRYRRRSKACS